MVAGKPDAAHAATGPLVNGEETMVTMLSPQQLDSYPYLESLWRLINKGFAVRHQPYFDLNSKRFMKASDIPGELQPEYFTYIVSSTNYDASQGPSIYATASARHLANSEEHEGGEARPDFQEFKRSHKDLPKGVELWELKLLVTEPGLQRTGLATLLQGMVEAEIKKRVAAQQLKEMAARSNESLQTASDEEIRHAGEIRLLLTTCKEVNEEYYLRRGYHTTTTKRFHAGHAGSLLPFSVVEMEKTL